ncbi:MAG: ABC transporter permease [Pseudomonadota bacterium]
MTDQLRTTAREARRQSSSFNQLEGRTSAWDGLMNFVEVHATLNLRFIATKFRENFLGYAWMFITPLTWIITMAFVFWFMGRRSPIMTDIVSFLVTGMIAFVAFRETFTLVVGAIRTNRHLFYFGHIKYFDIVFSTAVVELLTAVTIFWTILLGNLVFFGFFEIHDLGGVLINFLMVWAVGLSFGYCFAMLSLFSSAVPRLTTVILRPLFWVSGLFFIAAELPQVAQDVLYWNPVLHCIEGIRSAAFINYDSRFYDPRVPVWYIFLMFAAGQILERSALRNISVQQ